MTDLEEKAERALNKRLGTIGYINKSNCQKPYTDGYIDGATEATKQLEEAKKILSEYIEILKGNTKTWQETQAKAEAFLKE